MATDGPTPPPCEQEIYENGDVVAVIDSSSNAIERWVKTVADQADARLDWHYFAGRGIVKHVGDTASLRRVEQAIIDLAHTLSAHSMIRYTLRPTSETQQ